MTEPTWDPTGTVVVVLREDQDLVDELGGDPYAIAADLRRNPPYVYVAVLNMSGAPFGTGSHRLGLARWGYALRCVAPDGPEGPIQALRIGGMVAQILGNAGWRSRIVDGSKFAIPRRDEANMVGPYPDPDTKDPTVLVSISLVATAQAVP